VQNLYIIVPTYNEGDISSLIVNVSNSVARDKNLEFHFIVIDDGSRIPTTFSSPSTSNVHVRIEKVSKNLGPGAAFALGFTLLPFPLGHEDMVLLIEGDGTSDTRILPKMIARLDEVPFPYDLILASPYSYGGQLRSLSLARRLLSSLANESSRLIMDLRGIWTLSSFYRLFRGSAISSLQSRYGSSIIESSGFECMIELLLKSKNMNLSISEVATSVDQEFRRGGSKMKIIRTIKGYLKIWITSKKYL
jgi:dolichol-phosphate mannosyltransferase